MGYITDILYNRTCLSCHHTDRLRIFGKWLFIFFVKKPLLKEALFSFFIFFV